MTRAGGRGRSGLRRSIRAAAIMTARIVLYELSALDPSYSYLRQFTPNVLAVIDFRGGPGTAELMEAVAVLKEMNRLGAMTNHPPSMLYDVRHRLTTEVDFLSGAIAREAERAGVTAPLHTAVYRLIKGKETAWSFQDENKPVTVH